MHRLLPSPFSVYHIQHFLRFTPTGKRVFENGVRGEVFGSERRRIRKVEKITQ
jgi:hypothetical protein